MTRPSTANDLLPSVSIDGLLNTLQALTHQIHAATDVVHARDLRAQRSLVRAEIIRRAG